DDPILPLYVGADFLELCLLLLVLVLLVLLLLLLLLVCATGRSFVPTKVISVVGSLVTSSFIISSLWVAPFNKITSLVISFSPSFPFCFTSVSPTYMDESFSSSFSKSISSV